MTATGLHFLEFGTAGSPVLFCHGLFGQGKNWATTAKALADEHRVWAVDMPNHGRSPWTDAVNYVAMADDVADFVRAQIAEPVALVGHSMGGKAAMVLALRHPDLVSRLCVVDISPVAYSGTGENFAAYIQAMKAMRLDALTGRQGAEEAMQEAVTDPMTRAFLLQNLRHAHDGWQWLPNLDVIERDIAALAGWPTEELAAGGETYGGPVLWVAGADSPYVRDTDDEAMAVYFPRYRRVRIKQAGHWVHAAQPAVFTEVVRRFVDAGRDLDAAVTRP